MQMNIWMLSLMMMMNLIVLINGQCLTPLTAFGNSTIAPPVLDTQATGFVANPLTTNVNDTRFLSVRITWASVSNRILTWAGVGDETAAGGGCTPFVKIAPGSGSATATGGWALNPGSTDCFDEIKANYTWPLALYNPSCAALFTVDETDATYTQIKFDLIVKFNETYTTSRAGNIFTQVKTIFAKLPITLQFPKTVSVSSAAVRVYSASSVDVSADLIAQDVTNNPPYTISYVTLLGRSFALNTPVPAYGGQHAPVSNVISFSNDAILGTTRQSTWTMSITPKSSECVLTGQYNITYNLYWTGVDANGNPLPANQNPLPNNSTVTVTFDIQSQSFCATTITSSLQPTLNVFDVPPSTTTFYNGISERLGFFTNARVYFRAQVASDNLPIKSVRLTNFFITYDTTNRTDLVINGAQATASAPNIDYQQSLPLTSQPADQALFNMLLSPDVFQVLQDKDTEYIFNALLTVTYSTTGSKKKRELVAMTFSGKDFSKMKMRVLPVTGVTSIAATAQMTLQQTASTATPTKANIINTSSACGLIVSLFSLLPIFTFVFIILL